MTKLQIDCIADLHGYEPELPGGDILIIAGDMTVSDRVHQWATFMKWLEEQRYTHKIIIGGNHDNFLESGFPKNEEEAKNIADIQESIGVKQDFIYLCDSLAQIAGLRIWGTPWTPFFSGVNPHCKAFMDSETYLEGRFSMIPEDLDILITHGPPHRVLDENKYGFPCGSYSLKSALDRAKPRYHVFGHIHECGGQAMLYKHTGLNTVCINCSLVDESYDACFKQQRIEL